MKLTLEVDGADNLERFARGTRELAKGLRGPLIRDFANAVSRHTAIRARVNAPIDKGVLRKHIVATPATVRGSTALTSVKIDDSIKYAIAMYVHLTPYGIPLRMSSATGRPVYSLDKTLVRLPSTVTREGRVGGMFIERAFFFHLNRSRVYNRQLQGVITGLLKTGRRRRFRFRTR
jgi:hypothetical protein